MNFSEILSLVYQRQAEGDDRPVNEIIETVRADLAKMQPVPPGPEVIIGQSVQTISGVRKRYNVMGDGSMVEVQQ